MPWLSTTAEAGERDTQEAMRCVEAMTTRLTDTHLERISRSEILAAIDEVESWWRFVATSLQAKVGRPAGA